MVGVLMDSVETTLGIFRGSVKERQAIFTSPWLSLQSFVAWDCSLALKSWQGWEGEKGGLSPCGLGPRHSQQGGRFHFLDSTETGRLGRKSPRNRAFQ